LDLLQDIWQLKAGRRSEIKDRFVSNFHDYDALQGYADAQDERDLKAWIRVIESHSNLDAIPQEIALVRSCSFTKPQATTLALSTAHKSKGLEFGSVELVDDFPEAELANPLMYNRENYPQFWDEEGFKGGILLPVEEINLRYVAITRAEAACTSGQWPAPMFSGLADYVSRHPRFLTQEEAMTMQSKTDCNHEGLTIPLTGPAVHLPLLNEGLSTVVASFHKRYPLLRWDSLAQESQQGASSVEKLINRHQLHSARPLIAEFINALKSEDADIKDSSQQTTAQVISIVHPLTAEEEEQDFREWMKALNERRDSVGELNSDAELHSGLSEFFATEEEMARQLGPEAQPFWLNQWEVPDEPADPEEENMALEEEFRYSDELEQESVSYREWDDVDNFWNQEGVFEEMSDLSDLEQSANMEYNGSLVVIDEMEEKLGFDENAGLQEFYAEEAEMERQLGPEA
jgi:ATP-dependent exoDNAse (exonuclease V) beta subunit